MRKDIMTKKKRNYPKNRKQRDLDYSTVTKLLNKFGSNQLQEICLKYGMYTGAKILTKMWGEGNFVSSATILYMRKKFGWIRIIYSREDPNAKSVLSGKVAPEYFKTIRFSEDIINDIPNYRRN